LIVHLAFGCMAIGIAGSSLGSRETQIDMTRGEMIEWAGRSVRFADLVERDLKQKVVVAAKLEVTEASGKNYLLWPTQNFYRPQNEWGAKVAIHGSLAGDFYVLLHGGSTPESIRVTLMDHPLIRWLWIGGWLGLVGVVVAALPERRAREIDSGRALPHAVIPRPHIAALTLQANKTNSKP
jgi:cytochrome c biogenesis factor